MKLQALKYILPYSSGFAYRFAPRAPGIRGHPKGNRAWESKPEVLEGTFTLGIFWKYFLSATDEETVRAHSCALESRGNFLYNIKDRLLLRLWIYVDLSFGTSNDPQRPVEVVESATRPPPSEMPLPRGHWVPGPETPLLRAKYPLPENRSRHWRFPKYHGNFISQF